MTNPEHYGAYAQVLPAVIKRLGGRLEVVEGEAKQRNVVIAFDDYETARACWHSPEYAKVAHLREGAAAVDAVFVEGVGQ